MDIFSYNYSKHRYLAQTFGRGHQRPTSTFYHWPKQLWGPDLIALPARLGGLGVANPSHKSSTHFNNSKLTTAPLVDLIVQQANSISVETRRSQIRAKNHIRMSQRQFEKAKATKVASKLPYNLQRAMEVSSEKGALTWLTTLPIADRGFALHKGAFQDALCLRYGWCPQQLPSRCVTVCDQKFTIEHALSCHREGFPQFGTMISQLNF